MDILIKHISFRDVFIRIVYVKVKKNTIAIKGEYWTCGTEKNWRLPSVAELELNPEELVNQWRMISYNNNIKNLPCLKDAIWSKIDLDIFKEN